MTGRPPLDFVVDGTPRRYDFSDLTGLDIIVLFDPQKEPVAVSPLDLDAVLAYFGLDPR